MSLALRAWLAVAMLMFLTGGGFAAEPSAATGSIGPSATGAVAPVVRPTDAFVPPVKRRRPGRAVSGPAARSTTAAVRRRPFIAKAKAGKKADVRRTAAREK